MIFYLLLPIAMLLFAWKAAVFPAWGSGLLSVAVGVIASHAVLPLGKVSWRSKALLSISAAIVAGGVMLGFWPLHRPFQLFRANLSNQTLVREDLSGANLILANLSGAALTEANLRGALLSSATLSDASLIFANLRGALLSDANLTGARLDGANLTGAHLGDANLSSAHLGGANLTGANLTDADLSGAALTRAKGLDDACGSVKTKLPEGFSVKPFPVER